MFHYLAKINQNYFYYFTTENKFVLQYLLDLIFKIKATEYRVEIRKLE